MEAEGTPKALLAVGGRHHHVSQIITDNESSPFPPGSMLGAPAGLTHLFLITALGSRLHYNPATQTREMKLRKVSRANNVLPATSFLESILLDSKLNCFCEQVPTSIGLRFYKVRRLGKSLRTLNIQCPSSPQQERSLWQLYRTIKSPKYQDEVQFL